MGDRVRVGKTTAALILYGATLCFSGCGDRVQPLVVSGRVEMDTVRIGSKIGGRVAAVNAEEGDWVEAGAVVLALDDRELKAQHSEAEAAAAQAQAQLDLLLAGSRPEDIARAEAVVRARQAELDLRRKGFRDEEVRQAEAQVVSAESDLELARKELERTESLHKTGTVDQRELDRKRSLFETARAAVEVARQRASLYRSGSRPEEIAMAEAQLAQASADLERLRNGPRAEEIAAARAAVLAAQANVERIDSLLSETRILAPARAMVETLDLEPGDLVRAGEPVAVIQLDKAPYIRCYVPENRLGEVRPGQAVTVTVDSFPGRRFAGRVRRVNAEAEFTPRNVQTSEKRSELVFEMKVDVTGDASALRAGMYADVRPEPAALR
ncbi:MAG: HlyD family efflux transporter periplasmic adaptor subunit [Candidatus Sumerlaeaceae bacterium]|nr:HlyD family efflux transporter periplasmic adaptor subunit [Candidatus Sumerlaeaceae bacterium]